MPQRRLSDAKNKILEKVIAEATAQAGKRPLVNIEDFITLYFKNVAVEDLRERSPANLAGMALSHLDFGSQRKPGQSLHRFLNPIAKRDGWSSPHTVLQMVNDDMPFLVDSLGMVLNRAGLSIHLTLHPVFLVKRNKDNNITSVVAPDKTARGQKPESFVQIIFNRIGEGELAQSLEGAIAETLEDIRLATADWQKMLEASRSTRKFLRENPPPLDKKALKESEELLEWMEQDHFTYLGYREYDLVTENGETTLEAKKGSGLGILREEHRPPPGGGARSSQQLAEDIRKQTRNRELLIITKANSLSTVHRPGYLDYIGVKIFDAEGQVTGERRFLGLFTSVAYSRSPREIPLLRLKFEQIMQRSALRPSSHAGKALMHILENYPRDEFFQGTVEDLFRISMGISSLQDRQRIRVFIRRDAFRRFFSCLVFVPREQYNTAVRKKIEEILRDTFDGTAVDSTPQLSESVLARVYIIVRTEPGAQPRFNIRSIEKRITAAVRSWQDLLAETMMERFGEQRGLELFDKYGRCFPAAYEEDVSPRAASFDIEKMDDLGEDASSLRMSLYRPPSFPDSNLRFKVFHRQNPIPISEALPMLENMGLKVISERPYRVEFADGSTIWIQDFEMVYAHSVIDPGKVNAKFQQAFYRAWRGQTDNDGFNRLVLGAGLSWRQVAVLRAYCKYLLQTRLPFSQAYMENSLGQNPALSATLVQILESRHNPGLSAKARNRRTDKARKHLLELLDGVASQDDDRILRSFLSAIMATLRTNYFQLDEESEETPYISFKLDPREVPDLPKPRPMFEIFVYSPRVEGVHLRGGTVARGGLRWSDRREDFRIEVLGLMKAQMVKNTVIVPVGAKGGFVVKQLPTGTREEVMAEVVDCYKVFINGLLDLTDNIIDDAVRPPKKLVRHDNDDPYLVVAADKGTATFSDIANSVSIEHGFWLGDAFASGGSVGYDHKKMGITARGAWESVKRHFREIGVDTQKEVFTAAGIGDMSGDVFGNGMLLSPHIRLQAAFNHLHIFLDPDPDPASSFAERKRLFALPRSGWDDYNTELLSKGGGIFSRKDKQIKPSKEVRAMLDLKQESLTPQELITAILKMRVDLLWNGGIGTYVKASTEANADVGDRTNDSVRVNGSDLRCRVIGEGGNLGFTQLGRVEYTLAGGRMNTDFIDNSAGVDCSDREVNIKILLNLVRQHKRLTDARRQRLLAAMTDEVGQLVLRNNYLQSQAISMLETHAAERVNEHAHVIRAMERRKELDRALEALPNEEEIAERRRNQRGLTRPELAVLLSYSKISLYKDLLKSDVPEDAYLGLELTRYFPAPLQKHHSELMGKHRLRREIIANAITNSMINRMGPTFADRMQEEAGADAASVARAYTIAREAFGMREIWIDIENLDNQVNARVQYAMMSETTQLLKHATRWLLGPLWKSLNIADTVDHFLPGVTELYGVMNKLLLGSDLKQFQETRQLYVNIGVPETLSEQIALLPVMRPALDLVEVAKATDASVTRIADIYFCLAEATGLNWLRKQIEKLAVDGQWQAAARHTLRENLYQIHRGLTAEIQKIAPRREPDEAVELWASGNARKVSHAKQVLKEMRASANMEFATLSVAVQEIRRLEKQ
ncbi:MAG: NAD-glutamate dehydrogenase [Gammaproteobacteria bacterium]|nr:NAD-glutamate dehydrogenase [Gammaproteobacteria bacterium]